MGASRGESAASYKVLPVAPTFLGYSGLPGFQASGPARGRGVPQRVTLSVGFPEECKPPLNSACPSLCLSYPSAPCSMKTWQPTPLPCVSTEGPRCPVSTSRNHGLSGSGAMGRWMLAGLAASSTPPQHTYIHPERESCLCVPQVGDRPGSHDINPPLGPSPAGSKGLESVVEPNLHPHTPGTGHPVHEWVGGQ